MARLVVPYGFRKFFSQTVVEFQAETVEQLLSQLRSRVSEDDWKKLSRAFILVNGVAVTRLQGKDTPLTDKDEVWLVFPAGGG